MFVPPGISNWFRVHSQRLNARRSPNETIHRARRCLRERTSASWLNRRSFSRRQLRAGFTLLELVIVVGIIGLLLALIAPAFTTIKGGNDVTSIAYTVKGALDTARTYAKANNTYAWVGFAGSIRIKRNGRRGALRCCLKRRHGPWNQRQPSQQQN